MAGIESTSTTKPTTSVPKTGSSGSSGSGSYRSSGSGGYSSPAYVDEGPSYANQFYSAYEYAPPQQSTLLDVGAQGLVTQAIVNAAKANVPQANVQKVAPVDITDLKNELKQVADSETDAALSRINYAVQTGTKDLNRAYEDALPQYQVQRNQIAADEANALDNQVLYASKRGDSGGIGQSQYGSIQNTASVNQQTVNNAQVKLYTDTARQIADLKEKGEFEKADKIIEISNEYSKKLIDLQKWAKEKNVDVDQFNSKIDQWKAEYDLSVAKYLTDTELSAAKMTGAFSNGTPTIDTINSTANRYADSGEAMIKAGIVPSTAQLAEMGWTPEQYWVYRMANLTA